MICDRPKMPSAETTNRPYGMLNGSYFIELEIFVNE